MIKRLYLNYFSLTTILLILCFSQQSISGQIIAKKAIRSKSKKIYEKRVETLRKNNGLAAFWDFVLREDGIDGSGRFKAYTSKGDNHRYILEPFNISREFWHDGVDATMSDFPLLGRGPFGQAVQFKSPKSQNDLPVLLIPRRILNDSPLDAKGPGKSVSMLVWLIYQGGNHAIAGLWNEGTDSPPKDIAAKIKVRGQRQYGMFAGLGANPGGASVHLSDNGLASFGDQYARQLSVTSEKMKQVATDAKAEDLDSNWSVVGFVYNNKTKSVTAYMNGIATEYWIDNPEKHPFYKYAANAWKQAKLAEKPDLQDGEDVEFPKDQYYSPPETKPLSELVISETLDERVVIRIYEFTKVRYTYRKDSRGIFNKIISTDLISIKANPYWFGKDIYCPKTPDEGSPFTIGRVIHSNRHETLSALIGGVAVFDRVLSSKKMKKFSLIGRAKNQPVISLSDIISPTN